QGGIALQRCLPRRRRIVSQPVVIAVVAQVRRLFRFATEALLPMRFEDMIERDALLEGAFDLILHGRLLRTGQARADREGGVSGRAENCAHAQTTRMIHVTQKPSGSLKSAMKTWLVSSGDRFDVHIIWRPS